MGAGQTTVDQGRGAVVARVPVGGVEIGEVEGLLDPGVGGEEAEVRGEAFLEEDDHRGR